MKLKYFYNNIKKVAFIFILFCCALGYAQNCTPSPTNPDSDGDGIADLCDYDDDNDGILDINEDCPYLAQNENGAWIGQTTSNVTVTTNGTIRTDIINVNDFQNRYHVNNSGGGQCIDRLGEIDHRISFSTPVPASELAIYLENFSPNLSPSLVNIRIVVNGTTANNTFVAAIPLNTAPSYMNYNPVTGHATSSGSNAQNLMLKGVGNTLISTIQIVSTGIDVNDRLYYSFYGKKICDADGDGIPNKLDLDSDNDGCPDAIEGGAAITTTVASAGTLQGGNTGTTSGNYNQPILLNLGNTVNTTAASTSYGVPTVAGTGQSVGTSQTANTVITTITAGNSQTISSGNSPAAISLTGTTTGVGIQWQVSTDNVTFTNITSATGTSYSPGALTATRYYKALLTSAGGCTALTNVVTITVSCAAGTNIPALNSSGFFTNVTNTYAIPCGSTTANLSAITASNKPAPTTVTLTWHTGTPATTANKIAAVTTLTGTNRYYASFFDSAANCYSPTREVLVTAPICAINNDFTSTPITAGVGGTLPSIFANDSYNGLAITDISTITAQFLYEQWTPGNAVINNNGTLTIPPSTPPGTYTYYYKLVDTDPNLGTLINQTDAIEVKFTVSPNTDGDTLNDFNDWDDDNDGILDAVESPDCFYNSAEATVVGSITSPFSGAAGDPTAGANIITLFNGSNSDTNPFNFTGQAIATGTPIFTVSYPAVIRLTSLSVVQAASGMAPANRFGQLFGSNDGVNYTLISSATGLALNSANVTFSVTSATPYRFYQIRYLGTAATANTNPGTLGIANIQEITAVYNTTAYVPSANPKPTVCTSGADSDNIPNHLDLDSDGDGCPDAFEGDENVTLLHLNPQGRIVTNAAGAVNGNGIASVDANGVPLLVNSGGVADVGGDIGQGVGFSQISTITECLDSDGDGIPDICDDDDDNDGILDINERSCGNSLLSTVRIGYFPNSRDTSINDVGYTFDGALMSGSGALKLTNPANFGPSGIVPQSVVLVPMTTNPVTKADIVALNLNMIFIGGLDDGINTHILDSELEAIKDWSDDQGSNVVIATQFTTKAWGSTIGNGNVNPNSPTTYGAQTVFTGPFGTATQFNQAGGYQAIFTQLNNNCATKPIATAANGNTTIYFDGAYNDFIVADVDIFTTLGGVSAGGNINNNQDIFFVNFFAHAMSLSSCFDVDMDGDGIPNRLDLDSDGDGCPDAIEGGENVNTSHLNTAGAIRTTAAGVANTNGIASVDANGVPLLVNTGGAADTGSATAGTIGQPIGQSQDIFKNDCIDSDGDGVADWQDLDNDNDGILNKDECVGFIANNVTGPWKGRTASNITVSATPGTTQTNSILVTTDPQVNYSINQNGGDQRFGNSATAVTYILTFSTPVPANEIGLMIDDVNVAQSISAAYKIDVNFGAGFVNPSGVFVKTLAGRNAGVGYNATTGVPTFQVLPNPALAADPGEDIYLRGAGNRLVTAVRLTGTSLSSGDSIAYSFFALASCSADNDLIPNDLDVDSDNDGCPDAIEGSENVTADQVHSLSLPTTDANYPYRGQIKVIYNGTTAGTPAGIISNSPSAMGVPQLVNNVGNNLNSATNPSNLAGVADNTDVPPTADIGQGIGDSQNALVNGCFCYEDPTLVAGTNYPVKHGITVLGRAGKVSTGTLNTATDWPMNKNSAYTALEGKSKGFVVTRNASPETTITIPVVGMMVFDTDENAGAGCLKIYTGPGATEGWKCFSTQGCP